MPRTASAPPRTRSPRAPPSASSRTAATPSTRRSRRRCSSGFCEPQMCGIGGDCFVLLKPPGEERLVALNGSGRAPAGPRRRRAPGRGPRGRAAALGGGGHRPRAPSTPSPASRPTGAASGLPRASRRRSPTPRQACRWRRGSPATGPEAGAPFRRRPPLLPSRRPRARPPVAVFRAPGQAEVLRRIARDGRAAFYEGEVAEDMVASLRALGGTHTLDDFAATACTYVEPIAGPYRGHELVELPPNGAGRDGDPAGEDPRALRPRRPRPLRRRPRPPRGRGDEARLRRP